MKRLLLAAAIAITAHGGAHARCGVVDGEWECDHAGIVERAAERVAALYAAQAACKNVGLEVDEPAVAEMLSKLGLTKADENSSAFTNTWANTERGKIIEMFRGAYAQCREAWNTYGPNGSDDEYERGLLRSTDAINFPDDRASSAKTNLHDTLHIWSNYQSSYTGGGGWTISIQSKIDYIIVYSVRVNRGNCAPDGILVASPLLSSSVKLGSE